MKSMILSFTVALCVLQLLQATPNSPKVNVKDKILEPFLAKGNTKELFKVWHYIYNKNYEVNSQQGINSYVKFKKNLKMIQEHNAKKLEYTLGLNHLADMTNDEIEKYYGISEEITGKEIRKLMGFNLDDYEDSNEEEAIPKPQKVKTTTYYEPIDYDRLYVDVRDQGRCGSCWAFATMGAIEGNWVLVNEKNGTPVTPLWLSTQQLVDCDRKDYGGSNGGCNGGNPSNAMRWLINSQQPQLDKDYPYIEVRNSECKTNKNASFPIKVVGKDIPRSSEQVYQLLTKGPVATSVHTKSGFSFYKSGVFTAKCELNSNHVVILMGYGYDEETKLYYWKVRNSWGSDWGDNGYIKIKHDEDNSLSCTLTKTLLAVRPIVENSN